MLYSDMQDKLNSVLKDARACKNLELVEAIETNELYVLGYEIDGVIHIDDFLSVDDLNVYASWHQARDHQSQADDIYMINIVSAGESGAEAYVAFYEAYDTTPDAGDEPIASQCVDLTTR